MVSNVVGVLVSNQALWPGLRLFALLAAAWALAVLGAGPASAATAGSQKTRASAPAAQKGQARKPAATAARSGKRKAARVRGRPSVGQLSGLHATDDELALRSSVALVVDESTDEVLFSKNPDAVLPIASITKLMTALVVTDAGLPLDETLTVTPEDASATPGNRSRLSVGTQLSRSDMLHLALMASENRAAHVLGRTYPGGLPRFVEAMNAKAQMLGMGDTRYVEPTGLSSDNRSSAQDLARLVRAASLHPVIREFSTTQQAAIPVGKRTVQYRNTNGLVRHPEWEILLQKTGYISAAGRCVVMQAQLAGRQFIMVLLDSAGKYSRIADAERLRKWLSENHLLPAPLPVPPLPAALHSAAPVSLSLTPATGSTQPR